MKTISLASLAILLSLSAAHGWQTVLDIGEPGPATQTDINSAQRTSENTQSTSKDSLEKKLLNCLCSCALPGTNFSCSHDTKTRGDSPSCRKLENGPCLCVAYGCVRKPLPADSECTQRCRDQFNVSEPQYCEEGNQQSLSSPSGQACIPSSAPRWLDTPKYTWEPGKYSDQTQTMQKFNFCYDPLYSLLRQDIPSARGSNYEEKKSLYIQLLLQGYKEVDTRLQSTDPTEHMKKEVDASRLKTQPGDIVLVGFAQMTPHPIQPSEHNNNPLLKGKSYYVAPHYLIMENGTYFSQILNNDSGYIDDYRSLDWLFDKRDLKFLSRLRSQNKVGKPYKTYVILRQ